MQFLPYFEVAINACDIPVSKTLHPVQLPEA